MMQTLTRPTVQDAEATMCRLKSELTTVQAQLQQLHATAPLIGPVPTKLREARRCWYEAEVAAKSALVNGRQALAMLATYESSR
ncbi:hypothetical protein [Nesterenkonia alba]|uniref:hypothetical protein n=1 Tax=Nesterenkonia alba TaxID=515814 RepID=UPI0012EC354E|nr:hypothetical protein [Nesterenkonia alba]